MKSRNLRAALSMLAVFSSAMAIAFAQVRPIDVPQPPKVVQRPTIAPVPMPAQSAIATPAAAAVPLGRAVAPGTVVPLSRLPHLPKQTPMNTIRRKSDTHRVRPMAATGATITVTVGGGAACTDTVGTMIAVGCGITWQSGGITPGDQDQDYVIAPNVADGTAGTAVGGTYNGASGGAHAYTPATAGLYVFGTYDTTKNVWVSVVYVTVGETFDLRVYQDPFHTQETYQFAAGTSSNAYVYGTNLTASDYYVVYVESTSVNPHCVFSSPIQSSMPGNALCQPNLSVGQQAPGGNIEVGWAISASLPAGTYSVVLYDLTLSQRMAQVQVSITGSSGATMLLYPDGANANASPNPLPANPTPGTIFAYDGTADESTSGIKMSLTNLPNSQYIWSINDPTGATLWKTGRAAASGNASNTFNFDPNMLSPGNYVSRSFSAALYDTVSKTVYASQFFQVVGYYVATTFPGNATTLTVANGGSTTTTVTFTNSSPTRYGASNSDNFSKVAFTTGNDYAHTATGGSGVTMTLPGKTLAQCQGAGCTETITDSAGNSWNVTDICGGTGGTSGTTDECYVEMDPVSIGTTLAPNAYIPLPNVVFSSFNNDTCNTNISCELETSVLPQHGLTWSGTSTDAFQPSYVSIGSTGGTASVALAGAADAQYSSTAAEQVEAHLYKPYTSQAQYNRGTPYALDTTYYDILAFTIKNNSTKALDVLALGLPGSYGSFGALDLFALDPNLNAGNNKFWVIDTSCQNSQAPFGRKFLCLDGTGRLGRAVSLAANTQTTIYVDMNAAPGSFNYTDWQVFAADPVVFAMTSSGTATVPVTSAGANQAVDNLAYSQYSLDSSLMTTAFSPSTVGKSTSQPVDIVVTNTDLSQDPFPDYIDTVVIAASNAYSTTGNPSVVSPGTWNYIGSVTSGAQTYWWFSSCTTRSTGAAFLPPTTLPLTAPYANPQPVCNNPGNSLAPGATLNTKFTLQNLNTAGTVQFTMWAHGANGGGWTQGKNFQLLVNTVSAGVGFSAAGGYPAAAAVATNSIPTIGGNPSPAFGNAYAYTVTNNSATGQNITSFRVRIPGTDVSGVNATDSSGNFWKVTNAIPTLSGNIDGCTVTNALAAQAASVGGADGEIDIGGCALKPGDTIKLSFSMLGPQSQGDTYQFDTYCINNVAPACTVSNGTNGGANWIGDNQIQVQLSVGLSVVVDPSNPGPGSSSPVVSCSTCAFSGSTVDFGNYGTNTTSTFTDIVRASVIIQSNTALNWNLSVQANNNPTRIPAVPTNELLITDDSSTSTQGAGINFDVASYTVVPSVTALQVAHGLSVTSRTTPYDIIQSFRLSLGTETMTAQQSTITYTLVAN